MEIGEYDEFYTIKTNNLILKVGKVNHYILNYEELNKFFGTNISGYNLTIENLLNNQEVKENTIFYNYVENVYRNLQDFENNIRKRRNFEDIEDMKGILNCSKTLRLTATIILIIFIIYIIVLVVNNTNSSGKYDLLTGDEPYA